MKRIIVFFIVSAFIMVVYGQVAGLRTSRSEQKMESATIDQASIRCYYQFVQKDKTGLLQTDTMTLDIGTQMSEYYDIAKKKQDSLYVAFFNKIDVNTIRRIDVLKEQAAFENESVGGTSYSTGMPKESARLFKNRQTGEIVIIDYISSVPDKYRFTETIPPQAWQIAADTTTILGYTNVFNTRRYVSASYSETSRYYYAYDLRPAKVLVKIKFKIK